MKTSGQAALSFRRTGWWLAGGILCCFIALRGPGASQAAGPAEKNKNKTILNARGLTLPFYHGPDHRLSLVVKLDRITKENQRKGFFRIGVLPLMVVHEAKLDVRQPQYFAEAVKEFHQHVTGKDLKKTVELRGFTFTVPTNGVTLTATKGRIISPAEWELSGTVRLIDSSGTNDYTKVSLLVSGNETGTLRVPGGSSRFLFKNSNQPQ